MQSGSSPTRQRPFPAPLRQLLCVLGLMAATCLAPLPAGAQPARADTLYASGFDDGAALRPWQGARRGIRQTTLEGGEHVLHFRAGGKGRTLDLPLDAVALRGRKLFIQYRSRSAGPDGRPLPAPAFRFFLIWTDSAGHESWAGHQPASAEGWQLTGFTTVIPADARAAVIRIGLADVRGELWLDGLQVYSPAVAAPPQTATTVPPLPLPLRGTMVAPTVGPEDLETLADWGANSLRWQLTWSGFPNSPADTASLSQYQAWLSGALDHFDRLLPTLRKRGLRVILDLHTPPGGRIAPYNHFRLFGDTVWRRAFLETWRHIAQRYRDEPAIWGYDLVNEPREDAIPTGGHDWLQLVHECAALVRSIDSRHALIIEGAPDGTAPALAALPAPPVPGAVYSFHLYEPDAFTHQGVYGFPTGIRYPGIINRRYWDKAALRRYLEPVRAWQLRHGVSLYVGEFSAIRWAPDSSAYRYLADCISLFEEWGWGWSYHAFREWDGWSVEHDGDPGHSQPADRPTDRQLLLQNALRGNAPRR